MFGTFYHFLTWWANELRSVVPRSASNQLSANIFNYTLVYAANAEWTLYRSLLLYKRGQCLAQGAWPDVRLSILKAVRVGGLFSSTRIELAREISLVRKIKVPINARGDAADIARFDLEHNTPFQAQSVYVGHCISLEAGEDLQVHQYIVRKSRLEGVLNDLESCGVHVEEIAIADSTQRVRLNPTSCVPLTLRSVRYLWLLVVALLICCLGLLVWQTNTRIASQEQRIAALTARIKRTKANVSGILEKQRSQTAAFDLAQSALLIKRSKASALMVLSEISKRLPNDAWIKDFRLNGQVLILSVYASQPQSLISELSKSSLFQNVRFTSALTRAPGTSKEQFQLQLEIVALGEEGAGK